MGRYARACLIVMIFTIFSGVAHSDTTLRLTIQKPDGQPLAEMPCKLELYVAAQPGQEHSETRDVQTDVEGRLDLVLPPLARYHGVLTVEGLGHAIFGPRFAPKDGETVEIAQKLTRSGCILLHIKRKDDGTPVSNAEVIVTNYTTRTRNHTHKARSDRDGYCVIPDIAPGKCAVTAKALDLAMNYADVEVTGGDEIQRLEIELERDSLQRTQYSGVVLLEDGETPAVGAIVSLRRQNDGVRTDADGRFSLVEKPPWITGGEIRVWHEGYAKHVVSTQDIFGNPLPFIEVVLTDRGAGLTGVVKNADTGELMPGETVVAALYKEDPDREVSRLQMEPLVTDRLKKFERYNWYGFDWPRTVTDDTGRYEFASLVPGKYVVAVVPKDMPGGKRDDIIVEQGKSTEDVTVTVTAKPKGFVMFRFVNDKKEPVEVAFDYELSGGTSSKRGKNTTDNKGRCYLACQQAGERDLSIMPQGYAPLRKKITMNSAEFQEVVLMLQSLESASVGAQERGALTGKVLQTDGKSPAAGVFVVPFTDNAPFPESDATILNRWRFSRRMCVTTDKNGCFRIENLQPGKYGVVVTPPVTAEDPWTSIRPELVDCLSFFSDIVEVKSGQTADMPDRVFEKESVFDVRVVDAVTGKSLPTAKARIFYTKPPSYYVKELYGEPHEWHDADNKGNIHIRGLRAAEYGIEIKCDGYEEQSLPPVALEKAQSLALDLVKLRSLSNAYFRGVIRLPDGTPAAGAKILTDRVSQTPIAVADDEGCFELDRLEPGWNVLYVTYPGFAWVGKWFDLSTDKMSEVTFDLHVGGIVEAHVLDEEGQPAGSDIRVVLVPKEWSTRCTEFPQDDIFVSTPDEDGRLRFEHVPPGPTTLIVLRNRDVPRAVLNWPRGDDYEGAMDDAFRCMREHGIFDMNQTAAPEQWNLEAADGKTLEEALSSLRQSGLTLKSRDILSLEWNLDVVDGETVEVALTSRRVRGFVEGRVARPDGTPLARGTASIRDFMAQDGVEKGFPLDADGRYRIECIPGRWPVQIGARGESVVLPGVLVKADETTSLDITLGPYGTVSGKVMDADGQFRTGYVTARPDTQSMTEPKRLTRRDVKTDKEGRFIVENLLPGDYDLCFTTREKGTVKYATAHVEAEEDTEVDIVLPE